MPLRAEHEQILAYRLAVHNLAKRLPPGSLVDAAAACGLQNTPPGSAGLALNARVAALTPAELDAAVAAEKSLVQARSLRAAPFFCSTRDLHVFTLGLRPEDEESLRDFIQGAGPALDRVGISGTEVAGRTWAGLQPELAAVDMGGGRGGWLHEADLAALQSPPPATDVRLLPPHDPYLGLRDRDTLLPERARQRLVWRATGSPGVALVDGHIAGRWRPSKSGARLTVKIEPFRTLMVKERAALAAEADLLAPFRGCTATETRFAEA